MWEVKFEAVITLVLFGLFLYLVFDCGKTARLTCERDATSSRCTVVVDELLVDPVIEVYEDPRRIRVLEHMTNRRVKYYGIALEDRVGREHEVVTSLSEAEAQRAETWFVERQARVEVARGGYGTVGTALVAFIAVLTALAALLVAYKWREQVKKRTASPG